MIPTKLQHTIHQARYIYINYDAKEIYVWHGDSKIKILDFLGNKVGESSIVKYNESRDYTQYEDINIRDVTLSIDDIVHSWHKSQK